MKTALRLLAIVNLALVILFLLFLVSRLVSALLPQPPGLEGEGGCSGILTCYPILQQPIPIISIAVSAVIVVYKAITVGGSGNRLWFVGILILSALFALSFVLGQVGIDLPNDVAVVARFVLAGVASLISTGLAFRQKGDNT